MFILPDKLKAKVFPIFQRYVLLKEGLVLISAVIGMVLCSKLNLFWWAIPWTLQTLGVTVIGLLLSPGQAFLSLLTWITMGVMGVPVFAGTFSGPQVLLGVTGGYLWGMLFAAPLISSLYSKIRFSFLGTLLVSLIGNWLILGLGFSQLSLILSDVKQAWAIGVAPFLVSDFSKAVMASSFVRIIKGLKNS